MKFNTSKIKFEEAVSLTLILLSVTLLIYSTKCGLGLTNDSVTYLKGGNVLSEGGHFMDANYPKNIVPNGPLLPMILSFFGRGAESSFRILSCIFMLATFLCFKSLIFDVINDKYIKIGGIAAISFGTPLFMVYNFLWTESAFIFLLSIVLLYVLRYVKSGEEKYLIIIGAICFIATTLRMAGVIFPVIIFFMFYVINRRILKNPLFIIGLLLSIAGFILWRIYIISYEGGLEKITPPEEVMSLFRFQIDYLSSLGLWFLPNFVNETLRALFIVALTIVASTFLIQKKSEIEPHMLSLVKILLACIVFYYLVRSVLERDLDEIDRYLSEIYPLSIIVLAIIADVYLERITKFKRVIFFSIFFLWLLYPITRTVKNAKFWNQKFCVENSAKSHADQFSPPLLNEN